MLCQVALTRTCATISIIASITYTSITPFSVVTPGFVITLIVSIIGALVYVCSGMTICVNLFKYKRVGKHCTEAIQSFQVHYKRTVLQGTERHFPVFEFPVDIWKYLSQNVAQVVPYISLKVKLPVQRNSRSSAPCSTMFPFSLALEWFCIFRG